MYVTILTTANEHMPKIRVFRASKQSYIMTTANEHFLLNYVREIMSDIPNEIKILHIHKGCEDKKSFIEFIKLINGRSYILGYENFIKRYDEEMIKEFQSKVSHT